MEKQFLAMLNDIKHDKRCASFDEAATKLGIILRILSQLGWDIFNINEVYPEYSVGGKKVDYSLRHNNSNKVFIEVKKVGEDLEKHQEQLLNYSFQEGVKCAILTNGIAWWFYLPLFEGNWEQRKFYTVEIYTQDSNEILRKFIDFLSKDNVISGKANENAEKVYRGKQKQYLIKDTLPKAWKMILQEPDEIFIELLAEKTEKLCGYKPDDKTVNSFITTDIQEYETKISVKKKPQKMKVISITQKIQSFIGKKIDYFVFQGKRHETKNWRSMLMQICSIMAANHKDTFDRVLTLKGNKRPYFSKNPDILRSPKNIDGTDIYVTTKLNAKRIVKLSKDIISLFGYTNDDLSIKVR